MLRRYLLASIILVTVGVVLGAVLVSSFSNGVTFGLAASGGDVKLGGTTPILSQNTNAKSLSQDFAAVAKAASPSVVAINVVTTGKENKGKMPQDFFHFFGPEFQNPEPQPSEGSGSGVIITADGYIATNNHVVEDAKQDGIEVVLHDKVRFKGKVVGTDPLTDLAVIKIDAKDLVPGALGNSAAVQVGEWVLAIGNPLGLTSTVTAGIVSAIGRNINIIQDNYGIEDFIQTDAAINPGNSGGALVNMNGEVIGINAAIATTNARYQGYGFAIPVNILKTVASDLIKYGEVKRGYIGVQISAVDQTLADALKMGDARGVIVQSLVEDGAAKSAGIKEGDVILSVDGHEVNKGNELQGYIATRHQGDEVTLKIFRDGKTLEKKVTLRPRSGATVAAKDSDEKDEGSERKAESPKAVTFDELGFTVRSLTPQEKSSLKSESGVFVSEVKPFSEANKRGIGTGDVVLEADRKQIDTPGDLKRAIDSRKGGESVLLRVRRKADGAAAFFAIQIPK
jgi:serine protease Do